jgi:hypothetical protein
VLAEAAERPELVDRRAQNPLDDGRMWFDSYSVVAERRGELVKKAMMTGGKP